MTEGKEEEKISGLRSFDKREAQRKSLKEKDMQEAAEHWVVVSPKIVYEGNKVNSMLIWLDFIDRNGVIYIAPFIGVGRKKSNIRLSYTVGKDIYAISNGSKMEGDLVEEWTIGTMQKIVVRHNKLNTGITIQKVFGIEGLSDDKVERTIYIPMSRIYHIKTGELTIYKDEIEK
jgi:hypothetical protein